MKVKIKCNNCGKIEEVEYGILMNGEWKCVCGNSYWDLEK